MLYVNLGFWSTVPLDAGEDPRTGRVNRRIEDVVAALGGRKSLYSTAFYDRDTFWSIYGGQEYARLKESCDPRGRLPDLYAKVVGASEPGGSVLDPHARRTASGLPRLRRVRVRPVDAAVTVEVRSRRAIEYALSSTNQLGVARAYVSGDLEVVGDVYEALRRLHPFDLRTSPGPTGCGSPAHSVPGHCAAPHRPRTSVVVHQPLRVP